MIVRHQTTNSLVLDSPAKVNLFLQVLGRRNDGYHNINSLFQAVSLFDRMEFERIEGPPGVELTVSGAPDLPTGDDNLIVRAYRLIREYFSRVSRLRVNLTKRIPVAAGLGGGSSDAASTILACAILWDIPLEYGEMADLGLKIGSDLPFFFSGGQALVSGRGEVCQPVGFPTDYWLILATPGIAVSTAGSYAALTLHLTKSTHPVSLRSSRTALELAEALRPVKNDFEEVLLKSHPELGRIRDELLDRGALVARLSGSGPTFFGFFDSAPKPMTDTLIGQDAMQVSTVRPITMPVQRP